jgi:hypothetical protein
MMLFFWPYAPDFFSSRTEAGHDAPCYRFDLLAEMQDTLRALADIKARQEIEREKVEHEDAQTTTLKAA